jgi:hypothetical protein
MRMSGEPGAQASGWEFRKDLPGKPVTSGRPRTVRRCPRNGKRVKRHPPSSGTGATAPKGVGRRCRREYFPLVSPETGLATFRVLGGSTLRPRGRLSPPTPA